MRTLLIKVAFICVALYMLPQRVLAQNPVSGETTVTKTFKIPFKYVNEFTEHPLYLRAVHKQGTAQKSQIAITINKDEKSLKDSKGDSIVLDCPIEYTSFKAKFLEELVEQYQDGEKTVQERYAYEAFSLVSFMQLPVSKTPVALTASTSQFAAVWPNSNDPTPKQIKYNADAINKITESESALNRVSLGIKDEVILKGLLELRKMTGLDSSLLRRYIVEKKTEYIPQGTFTKDKITIGNLTLYNDSTVRQKGKELNLSKHAVDINTIIGKLNNSYEYFNKYVGNIKSNKKKKKDKKNNYVDESKSILKLIQKIKDQAKNLNPVDKKVYATLTKYRELATYLDNNKELKDSIESMTLMLKKDVRASERLDTTENNCEKAINEMDRLSKKVSSEKKWRDFKEIIFRSKHDLESLLVFFECSNCIYLDKKSVQKVVELDALMKKSIESYIKRQNNSNSDYSNYVNELNRYKDAYNMAKKDFEEDSKNFATTGIRKIEKVSLKIERGFIEDMNVWLVDADGNGNWYDNTMPIGVSSLRDLRVLDYVRLYKRLGNHSGNHDFIYLTSVLPAVDVNQDLQTRDLAPGDTCLLFKPNESAQVVLYRSPTIRLFDARIYGDILGLDKNSNNGIVQIEASRRFNVNTKRSQFSTVNIGYFNYINISAGFTKIEDKLKQLPLQNASIIQNGNIVSPNYATNLNLRRFESAFINMAITFFLLDSKQFKSMIYFEPGFRYGYVPIIDSVKRLTSTGVLETKSSVVNESNAGTFTPFLGFRYEFISDRRVGFSMSYQWNYTNVSTNNLFRQVASQQKSDLTPPVSTWRDKTSHLWEFQLRYMANLDDNIFLRCRFFFQHGDAQTYFPQLQLGYSFNLHLKR